MAVKIDGPYVSFAAEEAKVPDTSHAQVPIRAYDAAGRQLEQHPNSDAGPDDNGVEIYHMGFYGNVARVEIDSVESWAELDLPYDLTPAALLPAGHEGEEPEAPQQ